MSSTMFNRIQTNAQRVYNTPGFQTQKEVSKMFRDQTPYSQSSDVIKRKKALKKAVKKAVDKRVSFEPVWMETRRAELYDPTLIGTYQKVGAGIAKTADVPVAWWAEKVASPVGERIVGTKPSKTRSLVGGVAEGLLTRATIIPWLYSGALKTTIYPRSIVPRTKGMVKGTSEAFVLDPFRTVGQFLGMSGEVISPVKVAKFKVGSKTSSSSYTGLYARTPSRTPWKGKIPLLGITETKVGDMFTGRRVSVGTPKIKIPEGYAPLTGIEAAHTIPSIRSALAVENPLMWGGESLSKFFESQYSQLEPASHLALYDAGLLAAEAAYKSRGIKVAQMPIPIGNIKYIPIKTSQDISKWLGKHRKTTLYGSAAQRSQILEGRRPADIDITAKNPSKAAKELGAIISKEVGAKNVKISDKGVSVKSPSGTWHHAIDIHTPEFYEGVWGYGFKTQRPITGRLGTGEHKAVAPEAYGKEMVKRGELDIFDAQSKMAKQINEFHGSEGVYIPGKKAIFTKPTSTLDQLTKIEQRAQTLQKFEDLKSKSKTKATTVEWKAWQNFKSTYKQNYGVEPFVPDGMSRAQFMEYYGKSIPKETMAHELIHHKFPEKTEPQTAALQVEYALGKRPRLFTLETTTPIKLQPLSEQVARKATSIIAYEGKGKISPQAHRVKDVYDFIYGSEQLGRKLQKSKLGYRRRRGDVLVDAAEMWKTYDKISDAAIKTLDDAGLVDKRVIRLSTKKSGVAPVEPSLSPKSKAVARATEKAERYTGGYKPSQQYSNVLRMLYPKTISKKKDEPPTYFDPYKPYKGTPPPRAPPPSRSDGYTPDTFVPYTPDPYTPGLWKPDPYTPDPVPPILTQKIRNPLLDPPQQRSKPKPKIPRGKSKKYKIRKRRITDKEQYDAYFTNPFITLSGFLGG